MQAQKEAQAAWFETIMSKMTTEQLRELVALADKAKANADS